MARCLNAIAGIAVVLTAIPLSAANRPHSGTDSQNTKVWTNDDLEKIRGLGQLSVVGPSDNESSKQVLPHRAFTNIEDPEWYSAQATRLQDELDQRRAELQSYEQALEDARSLREMTGGINLEEGQVGLTPESALQTLRERVNDTQTQLDALQDLARRNGIAPGALRDRQDRPTPLDGF
jgi:hypothetical protein